MTMVTIIGEFWQITIRL